ncbi:MAG TPA: hypothetical protein VGF55_24735 [Gemmataceae bacterium]|jgi:hypothetical protein
MAKKSPAGNMSEAVKKAARAVGDAASKYVVRPVKKAVGATKTGGKKKSTGKKSTARKSAGKKSGKKR